MAPTKTEMAVGELIETLNRYGLITRADVYDAARRHGLSEEDVLSAWDRSGQAGKWDYGIFK